MRICIDARSPGKGGIRTYVSGFLAALLSVDGHNEYLILTDSEGDMACDRRTEIGKVPAGGPVTWFAWSNTVLPRLLERRGIRVYHTLKHVTAFRLRAKTLVTLHGAEMVGRFPRMYRPHDLCYWRSVYAHAARRYDRLLTATCAERDYVLNHYGIDRAQIRVVPFGVDRRFCEPLPPAQIASVRAHYDLPRHFILAVGRFHPIKNLEVLVSAFCFARPRLPVECSLVLAARPDAPGYRNILRKIRELRLTDAVRLLANAGGDLPAVYRAADLFVLPSLYESFCLTAVEAMASGLPVLASDIRQLDEVVGHAARRFDPNDPLALADAIVEVWNSPRIRESMRAQSLARARRFSWEACARETLKIYEEYAMESITAPPQGGKKSGLPWQGPT